MWGFYQELYSSTTVVDCCSGTQSQACMASGETFREKTVAKDSDVSLVSPLLPHLSCNFETGAYVR